MNFKVNLSLDSLNSEDSCLLQIVLFLKLFFVALCCISPYIIACMLSTSRPDRTRHTPSVSATGLWPVLRICTCILHTQYSVHSTEYTTVYSIADMLDLAHCIWVQPAGYMHGVRCLQGLDSRAAPLDRRTRMLPQRLSPPRIGQKYSHVTRRSHTVRQRSLWYDRNADITNTTSASGLLTCPNVVDW